MCVVSMVADHYNDKWQRVPWIYPPTTTTTTFAKHPTQREFDDLKREVVDLKELLKKAKEYDRKNNEPDCEIEEKINKLREIAKIVGIDLDEILTKKE